MLEEAPTDEELLQYLLLQENVDLARLRSFARRPGGFQTHELRRQIWPKLLGINRFDLVDYGEFLVKHRDDYQIWCDVTRLWGTLQPVSLTCNRYQDQRRKHVSDIISSVLCNDSSLYYYQGFHDVASAFLLVLDENVLAFAVLERATKFFFTDFMKENFDTFSKSMRLIMCLIQCKDQFLHNHFSSIPNFEPFFATSWIITWFAHELDHIDDIARIFDILLCSPPSYSYYLCAALILLQREEILREEADIAVVHSLLVKSPSLLLTRQARVIALADELLTRLPPARLLRRGGSALRRELSASPSSVFSCPAVLTKLRSQCDWQLLCSRQMAVHKQRLQLLKDLNRGSCADENQRLESVEKAYEYAASKRRYAEFWGVSATLVAAVLAAVFWTSVVPDQY